MTTWSKGGSGMRSGCCLDPARERIRGRGPDGPRAGRGRSRGGRSGARDLERTVEPAPNAAAAHILAAIYLGATRIERGLQMLLSASRIDPQDFRPWFAMGELVYLRLRRYESAIDAFQHALERQPGHPESRLGLTQGAGPIASSSRRGTPCEGAVDGTARRSAALGSPPRLPWNWAGPGRGRSPPTGTGDRSRSPRTR